MAANGKKTKLKEPVKVRTKKLADGSEIGRASCRERV